MVISDLVDLSQSGDDYQSPGSIEGRLPLNEDTTSEPMTDIQTTPATTSVPTSKEPETVDGCRLPQYPATDPDQLSENAWRFGTVFFSRSF